MNSITITNNTSMIVVKADLHKAIIIHVRICKQSEQWVLITYYVGIAKGEQMDPSKLEQSQ